MKPRSVTELIGKLREITNSNLRRGRSLQRLSDAQLNHRPGEGRWSALEAIEHVNRYGDVYLSEFARSVAGARVPAQNDTFTSSWLGNKLASGMKPGPQTTKVKTFPSKNPLGSTLDRGVLETFVRQQEKTLELLEKSVGLDWTATKIKTTIPLLTMRLGDGFRTYIYHNWRHVDQAERAVETY